MSGTEEMGWLAQDPIVSSATAGLQQHHPAKSFADLLSLVGGFEIFSENAIQYVKLASAASTAAAAAPSQSSACPAAPPQLPH